MAGYKDKMNKFMVRHCLRRVLPLLRGADTALTVCFTAFVAQTLPLPFVFPLLSRLRQRLCLVFPQRLCFHYCRG